MKRTRTVVIKLGTSSIVHETTHQPLLSTLALIVETAVSLRQDGHRVILVSSGAIGIALGERKLDRRPKHLPQVQALAAIGQCRLMALWDQMFDRLGQPVAQILLTRNDIADRTQYLNAQNTFLELLDMGIVPIVNENDTLSVAEIKFGDNDTLSAITAGMVQADYLFLMTDVDCLYDSNPRTNPDAKPIEVVENIRDLEADVSSAGSSLGTGGMSTKIIAARLATAAGVTTIITKSSNPGNVASIVRYVEGMKDLERSTNSLPVEDPMTKSTQSLSRLAISPETPLHTRFLPSESPLADRRFWLLHGLKPHGTIYIDQGAANALANHAGLLPIGIVDVEGMFHQQECVRIVEVPTTRVKFLQQHRHGRKLSAQLYSAAAAIPLQLSSQTLVASGTASPRLPTPSLSRIPSQTGGVSGATTPSLDLGPSPLASDPSAREVARALVNYSASEVKRIAGLHSNEIFDALGYALSEYVVVRDNLAMIGAGERPASRPQTPAPEGMTLTNGHSEPSKPDMPQQPVPRLARDSLMAGGLGSYVEG